MGTEAAPRLPGSASCTLMLMQFLQLCPWKWHSGCCVSPKGPPKCQGPQPPSCVPRCRKGLCKGTPVLSTARSLPCWEAAGLEPGLWGGGTEQGWGWRGVLSIPLESTAPRFASPSAAAGGQDAFDPLPSPISLPLNTNFHHPGVWQEQAE